jgi:hypothetical protein
MNQAIQSGNHPDAESLNAFVEQALTATEREQVLTHMATCSRCRQVVYLAQEAAGVERHVAAPVASGDRSSIERSSPKRTRSWFGGWRLAWIPVAAMAGFVGFAVLQHVRHTPAESQVAVNSPQQKLQEGSSPGRVTNSNAVDKTETVSKKAKSSEAEHGLAAGKSMPERADSDISETKLDAVEQANKPAAKLSADAVRPSLQNERDKARDSAEVSNSVSAVYLPHEEVRQEALKKPGAPDKAEQRLQTESKQLQTAQVSVSGGTEKPPSAPSASQTGSASFEAASPAANASAATRQSASSESNYKGAISGNAMADLKAKRTLLPNGTAALSTATAKGRTVALDASGAMYMTENAGKKWILITPQWAGRAVMVRTRETSPQSDALTVNNNAVFELINDGLQTWVSSDGRVWVPQSIPPK